MPEHAPPDWILQQFSALREDMNEGFSALRDEMRVQNGRVTKGEIHREALNGRIDALDKEVFRYPRNRMVDDAPSGVSKREAVYAGAGLSIILALIKIVEIVIMKAWGVVAAGMKG